VQIGQRNFRGPDSVT